MRVSFMARGGVDQENIGGSFSTSAFTIGLDEIYFSFANIGTNIGFTSREIQHTTNGSNWIKEKCLAVHKLQAGKPLPLTLLSSSK